MANQSRVQAGVPTGGEFATGARAENDDLAPDAPYLPERVELKWAPVTIGKQWRATGPTWETKNGGTYTSWARITPQGDEFVVDILDGMRKTATFSTGSLTEAKEATATRLPETLAEWGCHDGTRGRILTPEELESEQS